MKKYLNQWVNMGGFKIGLSRLKFNKFGGKNGNISYYI
jgi:hypothetical protein